MAYKLKVTRHALAEAYRTYEWLATESKAAPARWLRALFAKLETLKVDPQRYPLAEESSAFQEEIRELLVGKRRNIHRILFTIRQSTVVVLYIRHSARAPIDPPNAESN